jgi:hydrogenase nickel incorporation protein HypB
VEIDLSRPVLARNDQLAARNRARLAEAGVFMLDVLASPGAGKTTTILATLDSLGARVRAAVIEGDVASRVDADKVKAHGIPAVQINTGGACHLESDMISRALDALPLEDLDLVVVENVGNLVCPTEFDLGQGARIVILSVPEGHDKPSVRRLNGAAPIFTISAKTGEGVDAWADWVAARVAAGAAGADADGAGSSGGDV